MNNFIDKIKVCLDQIDSENLNRLKNIISENKSEIIILGNGGSNALSSHIAEDYTKCLKKKSFTFTDAARLTCYANDYGYDLAYRQFLSEFSTSESLVILISSSGKSNNILECAHYCVENNIRFITLSGFEINNPLNEIFSNKSLINFWVDSDNYGIVECCHEIILHSVV